MHEWALAEAVAESIKKEIAARPGSRLVAVNLRFGELQSIDREIFETGLDALLEEVPHEEGAVRVAVDGARFRCNACSTEWGFEDVPPLSDSEREAIHFLPESAHAYLHCPSCGGSDYQVAAGRGLSLESIELSEPEAAAAP